jgi:hypothetical protein
MTPSRATGLTPFFLAYGAEAMLSTELAYGSPRIQAYDDEQETTAAQLATDLLDEARDAIVVISAKYQQDLRRYHDRQVHGRSFNISNLVLRRVMTTKDMHKLSPPWEGPYVIAQILCPRTYQLKDSDGNILTNVWP